MPVPSVEEAFANMANIGQDYRQEGYTRRAAELNAAAQHALAQTIYASTIELRERMHTASEAVTRSIDRFTEASNRSSNVLAGFSEKTADATTGLKWATWALFFAAIVQAVATVAQVFVALSK